MFLGEFEYRIDEKGRVLIPPKFKGELKEGVVLMPGVERCILLYTWAEWKKLAASLTTSSVTRSKLRKLNRAVFATAFRLSIDGQSQGTHPHERWRVSSHYLKVRNCLGCSGQLLLSNARNRRTERKNYS